MEIKDAIWEKRNLFLKTTEIIISENDEYDNVEKLLKTVSDEYVVIKTPPLQGRICFLLTQYGYSYIETMVHMKHAMILPPLSEEQKQKLQNVRISPMEESDINNCLDYVKQGLYHTDRIAIDPYFSVNIANNRYIGWIRDEIAAGTVFWKYELDNLNIGFCGVRQLTKDTCRNVLSGLYPEFQRQGWSYILTHKIISEYANRGIKNVLADVSTNNIASLKRCLNNGFKITSAAYVYVKHNLEKEEYLKRLNW